MQVRTKNKFDQIVDDIFSYKELVVLKPWEMLLKLLNTYFRNNFSKSFDAPLDPERILVLKLQAILEPTKHHVFFSTIKKENNPFLSRPQDNDPIRYFILHLNLIHHKTKIPTVLIEVLSAFFFVYSEYQGLFKKELFEKLSFKDIFKAKLFSCINNLTDDIQNENIEENRRLLACSVLFRLIDYIPARLQDFLFSKLIISLKQTNPYVSLALFEIFNKVSAWLTPLQKEQVKTYLKKINYSNTGYFVVAGAYSILKSFGDHYQFSNFNLVLRDSMQLIKSSNEDIQFIARNALLSVYRYLDPDTQSNIRDEIVKLYQSDQTCIFDFHQENFISSEEMQAHLAKIFDDIEKKQLSLSQKLNLLTNFHNLDLNEIKENKLYPKLLFHILNDENENRDIRIIAGSAWLKTQSLTLSSEIFKPLIKLCSTYLMGDFTIYFRVAAEILAHFKKHIDPNQFDEIVNYWQKQNLDNNLDIHELAKVLRHLESILSIKHKQFIISHLIKEIEDRQQYIHPTYVNFLADFIEEMTQTQKRFVLAFLWNSNAVKTIHNYEMSYLFVRLCHDIETNNQQDVFSHYKDNHLPNEIINEIITFRP